MNISVIGATGATGKHFVEQALARGHAVTVLVRSPEKLSIQHPQLAVVVGNALVLEDVRQVASGQDAIFCALGSGSSTKKSTIRRDGTAQLLQALAENGEKPHVVILSSLGVDDSKRQMGLIVRTIVPLILRHPLADHLAQEQLVKESDLPWTFLRPTSLNDDAAVGNLHATLPPTPIKAQKSISRADVAIYALDTIMGRPHNNNREPHGSCQVCLHQLSSSK